MCATRAAPLLAARWKRCRCILGRVMWGILIVAPHAMGVLTGLRPPMQEERWVDRRSSRRRVPTARPTPRHPHLRRVASALAVRQACTFAGVPDPLTLVPAPPFGGFFVLPAAPELPEQTGALQLPFQQTQGQLHIVVMHRDGQHGLPSRMPGRAGCPTRARDPRFTGMVYGTDPPARGVALALSVRRGSAYLVRTNEGPSTATTAARPRPPVDRRQRDAAPRAAGPHSHLRPARPTPSHATQ